MIKYFLNHTTLYKYSNPVVESTNRIFLYPYNDMQQQLVSHKITVTGDPSIYSYLDEFNNRVGFFNYVSPHDLMVITSEAEIIVKESQELNYNLNIKTQNQIMENMSKDISFMPFLNIQPFFKKRKIKKIISELINYDDTILVISKKLCEYTHQNFTYKKGITNVFSTPEEVWKLGFGVCQDFTNILIQLCRLCKIPARYVSGYVFAKDGMVGAGATHAWVEVFIPNYGWYGLDPTNNCFTDKYHIRLAVGRSYNDCSPVKGVFKGNEKQEMKVKVLLDTVRNKKSNEINFDEISPEISSVNPVLSVNSFQKNQQIIQQQQ